MTEINGLLFKNNIILYSLIENIFIKFISMFSKLCDINIRKQLSIIIKIQDYQFQNENKIIGNWHSEGNTNDNIIGVGLYYFNIAQNEQLKFDDNYLEISMQECGNESIEKVKIEPNDCIVFKNGTNIKHRTILSTKCKLNENNKEISSISRKVLCFFFIASNH
eukprot:510254_1